MTDQRLTPQEEAAIRECVRLGAYGGKAPAYVEKLLAEIDRLGSAVDIATRRCDGNGNVSATDWVEHYAIPSGEDCPGCPACYAVAAQEIDRLRALVPQWQPISTAPSAGQHIIVWVPANRCTFEVSREAPDKPWYIAGASLVLLGEPTMWTLPPAAPTHEPMTDEERGLIQGLEDVAAGRVRSLDEIDQSLRETPKEGK